MLFAVVVAVAVAVFVPFVVVGHLAVVAFPIAFEEALTIVMRGYPACARIGRTGPVTGVPPVAASDWIPIAVDPGVTRAGAARLNPDDARRGWRADPDSDRQLSEERSSRQ